MEDWEEHWAKQQFTHQPIEDYLEKSRSQFDLLDPERPFYQAWGWELPTVKRKGPNELAQQASRGNNATLFDHTSEMPTPEMAFADASRNLIANQLFATAGGVSATGNRTGAPLVGQVVVHAHWPKPLGDSDVQSRYQGPTL